MRNFKINDNVCISSGPLSIVNQPMTIKDIDTNNNLIICVWFDKNGYNEKSFPPEVLILYEEEGYDYRTLAFKD